MAKAGVKTEARRFRKRRGAGRPPACEVAARIEYLLDTATDVFLKHGYEKANLNEIVERAGASKRTIYSRFPTKADLFIAVIGRKIQEIQEIFAKNLNSKGTLQVILQNFGTSFLEAMNHPDLHALYDVLLTVAPQFPKLSRTFWEIGPKQSMMMLSACLAHHPEFKGKDTESAAEIFCSMCWGLSILQRQLLKDYIVPETVRRRKTAEAVRIFMLVYT